MTDAFELSLAAVDILSVGLGIDPRVFPFEVPSVGYYPEDRVRITQAVWEDLRRCGLAGSTELAPEVERALRVFGAPRVAVAVLGSVAGGREVCARVSAAGRHGVLVVRESGSLRFEPLRPEALAATAAGLLPGSKAGPGTPVTVLRPAGAPVSVAEQPFPVTVRVTGPPSDAARRGVREILRRPRLGGGVLVVSGRGREAPALGWIDTDAGRYLTVASTDDLGDTRTTFFPADEARLRRKLAELLDSVSRPWSASGPGRGIRR